MDIKICDSGCDADTNLQHGEKIGRDARPGSSIEFNVEMTNMFADITDISIEDIDLFVTIEGIDDGDDLDERVEFDDLDPGDDDNVRLVLDLPLEIEEDEYLIVIEAEGETHQNGTQQARMLLTLEVKKEEHEVRFTQLELSPSQVQCERAANLDVGIMNTGSNEEEDVVLEITQQEFNLNLRETFDLSEDPFDEDSKFRKSYRFSISDKVAPGIYPIEAKVIFNNGRDIETDTVEMIVVDCNHPPLANAGSDATTSVNNQVTLFGSNSFDPDGDLLSYSWLQTSGPANANLSSSSIANPIFNPTQLGSYTFMLTVNDGEFQTTDSVVIVVNPVPGSIITSGQFLAITDLDVKVDSKSDTNLDDGDKISDEAEPGSTVKFNIEVSNLYSGQDDIEIQDIEVTVTIEGIDDGDDLEEEANDFDLDADDNDDVTLTFDIPYQVEADEYDVTIEVEGEDENGTTHKVNWDLELEVEKEDNSIIFTKAEIAPAEISCGKTVRLNAELLNIGEDEQDDVKLELVNEDLGINIVQDAIQLDTDTEDDASFTITKTAAIGEAKAGIYDLEFRSYYDGNLGDTKLIPLMVNQCNPAANQTQEKSEQKTSVPIKTQESTIRVPEPSSGQNEITGDATIQVQNSKQVDIQLVLLIGLIVIMIILICAGIYYLLSPRK